MVGEIFVSTIARSTQKTLEKIIDDKSDNIEGGAVYKKYLEVRSMDKGFIDFLEMGGAGLATSKAEGAEITLGTIREGTLTRIAPTTYAIALAITEEAFEDGLYPEAIALSRRNKRAMFKTVEYVAASHLARMFNANFTLGDGLCLGNANHLLPDGSAFSNIAATAIAPCRQAVIIAKSAVKKYPGHDGLIEGWKLAKIICPTEQESVWEGVTESEKAPEPGAFNEINVVKKMRLEVVGVQYWNNTTTSYAFQTDAEDGACLYWRRKPRSASWVDNNNMVMKNSISSRFVVTTIDARGWYCVNA